LINRYRPISDINQFKPADNTIAKALVKFTRLYVQKNGIVGTDGVAGRESLSM
jgi:hypothetical protein